MTISVLLVAHAPLASAIKAGALHVLPDAQAFVIALDVHAGDKPEITFKQIMGCLNRPPSDAGCEPINWLVITDVAGATPYNQVQAVLSQLQGTEQLGTTPRTSHLTGMNLPMVLRALNYRNQSMEQVAYKALAGGIQGMHNVVSA